MLFQTDPSWAPADYRAALDTWQATAPANDNEIFQPFRKPVKPSARHTELEPVKRAIWIWRHLSAHTEAHTGGAWLEAANDNDPEAKPRGLDQGFDATPSIDQLLDCVTVEMVGRVATVATRSPNGAWTEPTQKTRTWTDDVETIDVGTPKCVAADGKRVDKTLPRVVRFGGLHLNPMLHEDRHIDPKRGFRSVVVPHGAILAYQTPRMRQPAKVGDKYKESKSTVRVAAPRNSLWAKMFKTETPGFIKRGKLLDAGKRLTAAQGRELIAEAMANTPVLPPVTRCPPGLPSASRRVSDSFVGCKPNFVGRGAAPSFETLADMSVSVEQARGARAYLGPENAKALDVAMTAKNMADIGAAFGKVGKNAERVGKEKLKTAAKTLNDFLSNTGFFRAA